MTRLRWIVSLLSSVLGGVRPSGAVEPVESVGADVGSAASVDGVVGAPLYSAVIVAGNGADGVARAVLVVAESAAAEVIVEVAEFGGADRRCGAVVVDAFEYLQKFVVARDVRAEVYIGNREVRDWFAGLTHSHLTGCAFEGRRAGVRVAAEKALAARLVRADLLGSRRVVIATDASARAGRRGMGLAYVTDDGDWRQEFLPSTSVVAVGELEAILLAVTVRSDRRISVLTDSRSAVCWIDGSATPPTQVIARRVAAIRRAIGDRDVTVGWVKAHSGHPLNEIADRLAVAARRNAAAGVSTAVREQIARNIVDDLRPSTGSVA
ncbi:RNase H family protein [Nocardia takedensis]